MRGEGVNDHLSRTIKTVLAFLVAGVVCMLCSCRSTRTPTVTTTTTRAIHGPSASSFSAGFGVPVETTTVQKPYDPFGEAAGEAGIQLFSQP